MKTNNLPYILQALIAAIFFGASAPIAKLLLGDISPIFLAGFLYLGSGSGVALVKLVNQVSGAALSLSKGQEKEAGIKIG